MSVDHREVILMSLPDLPGWRGEWSQMSLNDREVAEGQPAPKNRLSSLPAHRKRAAWHSVIWIK